VARCHFDVRAKKGTLLAPKNCEHEGFSLVLFRSVRFCFQVIDFSLMKFNLVAEFAVESVEQKSVAKMVKF
jgi:hypothetical protein